MTKRVTVIVEGCKYEVEVGDLSERPIRAVLGEKTYEVDIPARTPPPAASPQPSEPKTAAPTPVRSRTPAAPVEALSEHDITAPMPGDILEVNVKAGDRVEPGDLICVLEAMKMKNMIRSNREGVIDCVNVRAGEAVEYGTSLVTFEQTR